MNRREFIKRVSGAVAIAAVPTWAGLVNTPGKLSYSAMEHMYQTLSFGFMEPTLILGNKKTQIEIDALLAPLRKFRVSSLERPFASFKFNHADVAASPAVKDGTIYFINEKKPNDKRFNGVLHFA